MESHLQCPSCHRRYKTSGAGVGASCPACGTPLAAAPPAAAHAGPAPAAEAESVSLACPACKRPLKLTRAHDGRKIRCAGCQAVLVAGAHPWKLTVVSPPAGAAPPPLPMAAAASAGGPPPLPGGATGAAEPPPIPGETAPWDLGGPPPIGAPYVKRKTSKAPLLIGGIAAAVVLLLLGGGLAWYLLGGSGPPKAALKYLPDNPKVVACVDVPAILKSKIAHDLKLDEKIQEMAREHDSSVKLSAADFGRVTFGGDSESSFTAAVELTSADAVDTIRKLLKEESTEKEVAGQKVLVNTNGKEAVWFPDARTMVVGTEPAVRAVISRKGPAKLSKQAEALWSQIDSGKCVAIACEASALGASGPLPPQAAGIVSKLDWATLHVGIASDVRVSAVVNCKDAETAKQLGDMAKGMVEMAKVSVPPEAPPETKKILESLHINQKGSRLTADVSISGEMIKQMVDQAIEAARAAARSASPVGAADGTPADVSRRGDSTSWPLSGQD